MLLEFVVWCEAIRFQFLWNCFTCSFHEDSNFGPVFRYIRLQFEGLGLIECDGAVQQTKPATFHLQSSQSGQNQKTDPVTYVAQMSAHASASSDGWSQEVAKCSYPLLVAMARVWVPKSAFIKGDFSLKLHMPNR